MLYLIRRFFMDVELERKIAVLHRYNKMLKSKIDRGAYTYGRAYE